MTSSTRAIGMRYLIDGYNLLHAMGALTSRAGPGGLEKARLRLLGWLAGALRAQAGQVTVVFDARQPPPGARPHLEHQGIQVLFAIKQEADDLIEELIQREGTPRQLTIVSDDHRLHDAARRRGCPALDALDYFELVERGRRRPPAPKKPTKEAAPEKTSPQELQHWLDEFADLQGDPDFKEFLEFDVDDPGEPRGRRRDP